MPVKYFLLIFTVFFSLPFYGQESDKKQQSEEDFEQREMSILNIPNSLREDLIHPNPSEGIFYLKSIKAGDDISVFDGTGRMVFNTVGEEPKMKIDIAHLEKGVYSVIVRDHDKKLKINQKVMIK